MCGLRLCTLGGGCRGWVRGGAGRGQELLQLEISGANSSGAYSVLGAGVRVAGGEMATDGCGKRWRRRGGSCCSCR